MSLRIHRVVYPGGGVALRDIALDVAAGEIVGVAGHVGAGKTTLALAAAGLLGRSVPATVDGTVTHAPPATPGGASAALVLDDPWAQLTDLGGTVEEEVAVGPENLGLPSATIRDRTDRALALARAERLAPRVPRTLSGGEMQRVALAAALALESPCLVLDEPTAQLDPASAARFAEALRALARTGVGVLLVEQNLDLLLALSSRVVLLAEGAPIALGAPAAVLDRWPPLDPRLGAPASVVDRECPMPVPEPARAAPPLLEIDRLSVAYGDREVLSDVTHTIPAGRVEAWLGENGAGKTTLARTIIGLVRARSGSVRVGGVALDRLPVEQRARFVGLVFQDPARQLFSRTVLDETLFGPRALGIDRAVALAYAHEALDLVGLGERLDAHPGDLAPQAQRRLAIAAALAARPPLLILDEPTAGQDAAGRAAIARALDHQRRHGSAAVITHDRPFARRHCDQSVTLEGGRMSNGETG